MWSLKYIAWVYIPALPPISKILGKLLGLNCLTGKNGSYNKYLPYSAFMRVKWVELLDEYLVWQVTKLLLLSLFIIILFLFVYA
jgi:hypothetical protein